MLRAISAVGAILSIGVLSLALAIPASAGPTPAPTVSIPGTEIDVCLVTATTVDGLVAELHLTASTAALVHVALPSDADLARLKAQCILPTRTPTASPTASPTAPTTTHRPAPRHSIKPTPPRTTTTLPPGEYPKGAPDTGPHDDAAHPEVSING